MKTEAKPIKEKNPLEKGTPFILNEAEMFKATWKLFSTVSF
jgi:hypothetical protein